MNITELEANNCCSIIAMELSKSVANSAKKESIAHIFFIIVESTESAKN